MPNKNTTQLTTMSAVWFFYSLSEYLDYFEFFLEFGNKIWIFFTMLCDGLGLTWLRSFMVPLCNLLFQRSIFRNIYRVIFLKINSKIRILACFNIFFCSRFPSIYSNYSFEYSGVFRCFAIIIKDKIAVATICVKQSPE